MMVNRLIFIFLVLFLNSCARYHLVEDKFYEDKKLRIDLVNEVGPQGLTVKKNFRHPVVVSEGEVKSLMQTLHHKDPVFLWKEKDRPIFEPAEINALAPLLTQALAKANTDHMIGFSITTFKRDLVFGTEKLTNGLLFFDDQGAHWVFGNVNFSLGQDGDPYLANPTYQPPKGVKIIPQEKQTLYRPEHPRWYQSKVYDNWLIVAAPFGQALTPTAAPHLPLEEKTPEVRAETKPTTASSKTIPPQTVKPLQNPPSESAPALKVTPKSEPGAMEEENSAALRLRKLKELRRENLISERDYETKKKEILKEL